ncbi:MAG: zf-TFIIB domain-containing protein [Cyanobacteria bacterium P01_D01_bin.105]
MECPICHKHSLHEVRLDTGLLAHQCHQCFGYWISSEHYWEWLQYREQEQRLSPAPHPAVQRLATADSLPPVNDNSTANLCADCGRLMTKAKVGRGLNFYLDRCSHCHGVWLDQHEWDHLKQQDLHHKIHYMFSSAWQFSVRKETQVQPKRPAWAAT